MNAFRKRIGIGFAVCLVLGLACFFYVEISRLGNAERLAKFGLWPDARRELLRYLRWRGDDRAHLLVAESYIKDEQLDERVAIDESLKHLQMISDESELAARARVQESRVELLLRHRPWRAEKRMERSLALDPGFVDAHLMMWKLFDLTGRSHLAEQHFWIVHDAASQYSEKAIHLRAWYMSQFYPATANPALERLMGLTIDPQASQARNEAFRFIRFRNAEPDRPIGYAALARTFQMQGDLTFAMKILDEGKAAITADQDHPFFLATIVSVAVALGDFQRADQAFRRWPEQHANGYEYWMTRATVLHEVRGEYASAIQAFDQALAGWPGVVDWRLQNRKADCLARLRRPREAAEVRARAKNMENQMAAEIHRKLRDALGHLDNAERVSEMTEFYERIGRQREARAWESVAVWLRSQSQENGSVIHR